MDKKVIQKIEDGFCEVLHKYAETGMRGAQDVEVAKAALSGMVKIKMLEEMEKYSGYSERGYRDGGSNDGGSYRRYRDDGISSLAYRDEGGSYRSYDNMHHVTDKIFSQLEKMYEQANNQQEKKEIQMWMNRLESQK